MGHGRHGWYHAWSDNPQTGTRVVYKWLVTVYIDYIKRKPTIMTIQTQKPVTAQQITQWCSWAGSAIVVLGIIFSNGAFIPADGELLPFQQEAAALQAR